MAPHLQLTHLFFILVVTWRVMLVAGSVLKCPGLGRYPHPSDCGSYITCLPTGPGGQLEATEGSCSDFPYSASKRRCVSHDEEPLCVAHATRNYGPSFPVDSYDFLCRGPKPTGCHHCKLSYYCVEGKAYITVCSDGGEKEAPKTCTESSQFGGHGCVPYDFAGFATASDNDKCLCSSGAGVHADSYNSSWYYYCDSNSVPVAFEVEACPDGKVFSSTTGNCEEPSIPQVPDTPACDGGSTKTRVNPNDCSRYYTCLPSNTVKTNQCPGQQYYDEVDGCKNSCDFVNPSGHQKCKSVGKTANPKNCVKYYECVNVGDPPQEEECAGGEYFDLTTRDCIPGTTVPTQCNPLCQSVGNNPDPNDCFAFYRCLAIGADPLTRETCPSGTYYNSSGVRSCVFGTPPGNCASNTSFDYTNCPGYTEMAAACP